jgi:hypothetical protein
MVLVLGVAFLLAGIQGCGDGTAASDSDTLEVISTTVN